MYFAVASVARRRLNARPYMCFYRRQPREFSTTAETDGICGTQQMKVARDNGNIAIHLRTERDVFCVNNYTVLAGVLITDVGVISSATMSRLQLIRLADNAHTCTTIHHGLWMNRYRRCHVLYIAKNNRHFAGITTLCTNKPFL